MIVRYGGDLPGAPPRHPVGFFLPPVTGRPRALAVRHASVHGMINTLAVISQKGGSGKTTLALGLAAAHERADGQSAVIDLDPQGSATVWGRLREGVPPR